MIKLFKSKKDIELQVCENEISILIEDNERLRKENKHLNEQLDVALKELEELQIKLERNDSKCHKKKEY